MIHEVFDWHLFTEEGHLGLESMSQCARPSIWLVTDDFYKVNQKPASVVVLEWAWQQRGIGFPWWSFTFLIALLLFCIGVTVVWSMRMIWGVHSWLTLYKRYIALLTQTAKFSPLTPGTDNVSLSSEWQNFNLSESQMLLFRWCLYPFYSNSWP